MKMRHISKILCILFVLHAMSSKSADVPELNFANNQDLAPYSYLEGGVHKGILVDILKAISSEIKDVKIKKTLGPWKRVQKLVEVGDLNAICAFPSDKRMEYISFNSIPLVTLDPALFFAKTHPDRDKIKAINNKTTLYAFPLVMTSGDGWGMQHFGDAPDLIIVEEFKQVFTMLQLHRAAINITVDKFTALWTIDRLHLDPNDFQSIGVNYLSIDPIPIHLGIIHGIPNSNEILREFDRILKKMHSNGEIDKIISNYAPEN